MWIDGEKLDNCPDCGTHLDQSGYDLQACRACGSNSQSRWRPIATAPRPPLSDTSATRYILGYCPEEIVADRMRVIWWEPNIGGGQWYDDRDIPDATHPTHWMPLPAPPATINK